MGSGWSNARWEYGFYPRPNQDGELPQRNNGNMQQEIDMGDGGGAQSDVQMTPLSSILPQVHATKSVTCKVNILRDTIFIDRIDKPVTLTKSVVMQTAAPSLIIPTTTIDAENYPTIQEEAIVEVELEQPALTPNESTTTTTTTTTSTNTTSIFNKSIEEEYLEEDKEESSSIEKPALSQPTPKPEGIYNIKFKFDTEEPCIIDIYIVATDTLNTITSCLTRLGPYYYQEGLNQQFSLTPSEYIDISKFTHSDLTLCNIEKVQYPVIITLKTNTYVVEEKKQANTIETGLPTEPDVSLDKLNINGDNSTSTSTSSEVVIRCQFTYLALLPCNDQTYAIKPLKQKIVYAQQSYIVHDIYGLENSDDSRDCVVCLTEPKEILTIPCRHFCLCSKCAETMKTVSIKCPICRSPIRSFLKINTKDIHTQL